MAKRYWPAPDQFEQISMAEMEDGGYTDYSEIETRDVRIEEMEAQVAEGKTPCVCTEDRLGYWTTDCGTGGFTDGLFALCSAENSKYCQQCGHPLQAVPWVETEEDG